jgi:hypothetical protein
MLLALTLRRSVSSECVSDHLQINDRGMPNPLSEFGCAGISQATQ